MRRYNERVYRVARAIVRDEQEAEDVMQQAYVDAFQHLAQFNGAARFSTWLTRIVVNESLARLRRRRRYETFDDALPNVERFMWRNVPENPERQAFSSELRGLLEWAVDTLPDGMREVFVLREIEGMSTSEVAESLGVSDDVSAARRGTVTFVYSSHDDQHNNAVALKDYVRAKMRTPHASPEVAEAILENHD